MELNIQNFLIIGLSYLLGSVPFGFIIVKLFYKKDIRKFGSGNPGATNVGRSFGKKPGIITLLLDILKGFIPVFLVLMIIPGSEILAILSGLSCIVGHNWSIFLMGKGGKGVATSGGVFLALLPQQMAVALGVFAIFLFITKHVSVGSMAAAVALMSMTFIIQTSHVLKVVVLVSGIMILIKHIPNMKRLKEGTESKVKFL